MSPAAGGSFNYDQLWCVVHCIQNLIIRSWLSIMLWHSGTTNFLVRSLAKVADMLYICMLNWTAKETCHFCQRPQIKIHNIEINNFFVYVCCNTPYWSHVQRQVITFVTKRKFTWIASWLLNQKSQNVTELYRNQCHRMKSRIAIITFK